MECIPTFLPVFTGFYCNHLYNSDDAEISELEYINKERAERNLKPFANTDALTFDYKDYFKQIAEHACNILVDEMSDYISHIDFEAIYYPREYNFSSDSINCKITPKIDAIRTYLKDNKAEFAEYIKEHFTSRSGFISFYPSHYQNWLEYFDNGKIKDDPNVLGTILNFIAENEEIEEEIFEEHNAELSCSNTDELIGLKIAS